MMKRRQILGLAALFPWSICRAQDRRVALAIAAGPGWLDHAGGTIAQLAGGGVTVHLIRIANEENDGWDLSREEAALRNRQEEEAAAKSLGVAGVESLGYRSSELRDVPHTSLRDRLIFSIRHYKPQTLFIPNPHTEFERDLDLYYAGAAAEDAWHCARYENFLPAASDAALGPHLVPEVYYYASPVDPRRRDPESTSTFVPQPKQVDISAVFERKLQAALARKTINRAMAMQIRQRLESTGRHLPALDKATDEAVDSLVKENLSGLATLCAKGTSYRLAEEFRYAGVEFQIPASYR